MSQNWLKMVRKGFWFLSLILLITFFLIVLLKTFDIERLSASLIIPIPSRKDKASSEPCTFALFRDVMKRKHNFPGEGKWHNLTNTAFYQPKICTFRFPRVPHNFMSTCLKKANISYILTMGDSTATRYYKALLKTSTIKFTTIRQEHLKEGGFLPDVKYFAKHLSKEVMKFVKAKFRFCSGCSSKMSRAVLKNNHSTDILNIEHIAQTMILDDSLEVVYPSYDAAKRSFQNTWAITTQELIIRHYLNEQHPDLVLIFLPFSHAKVNIPLWRLSMEIRYFKSLVDQYLPEKMKIIYMPAHGEHEKRRNSVEWRNRLFEGMLAAEKLDKMNRILYDILENDLLNQTGRYYGFLDLFHLTKDRYSWSLDGVHLKSVWYETAMSMFWETYCNSVLMDRF